MKLKTLLLALLAFVFITSCSDDDKTTDNPSVLPTAAKTLVSTYFPNVEIRSIEIEKDSKGYDVLLADGTEIDFDRQGNLEEVDCSRSTRRVPDGLILPAILDYVNQQYPGQSIVKYDVKQPYGYEAELQNGLDLIFSRDGVFQGIDS